MTKLAKVEHVAEEKAPAVPRVRRPSAARLLPRWMERFEEFLAEPLSPVLRFRETRFLALPPIDVYEDGDVLVVKAELPGMKKEEVTVNVTANALTISGKKTKEEQVERKDYRRVERAEGAFVRTVQLPAPVRLDEVTATYRDGVLEIRAPKAKVTGPEVRSIPVS